MNVDNVDQNRNVIPRLRNFKTTLALGELDSLPLHKGEYIDTQKESLEELITDWKNHRSLSFATDLVGSGFALGKTEEVKEAADFILSDESQSTKLQKRIAKQAKDPDYFLSLETDKEIQPDPIEIINHSREQVKTLREELRTSYRNPVKLVELSREYATLGSLKKAVKAMDTAVSLAPANRFVLRSATRLYIHAGEIEKAHYALRHAPSLRSDPWLLAAEIAVASQRDQTSHNVRNGMRKIEDANYNPFELSELISAIATLEMSNANSKIARKLFKRSLKNPTENSIAQAEWASRMKHSLNIEVQEYNVPRNFEALAWSNYKSGDMGYALKQGKLWIFDQPFAVSPVVFSGMVSSLTENFALGIEIYKFGLRANPDNVLLRNNYAYTLASNDKPELAQIELERLDRTNISIEDIIAITATEGLIKFRLGIPDEGRVLYRRAMDIASQNNKASNALRALIYLAREEIYAETSVAIQTLEAAQREAKRFSQTHELTIMFNRLNSVVESNSEAFHKS